MPPAVVQQLEQSFTVHSLWNAPDKDALLAQVGPAIRGIASNTVAQPLGSALFDRLPNLEIIANYAVGYDNIDIAEAARRGIMVTNTPGVLDAEVADFTIGLTLATIREIPQADRFVRDGDWLKGGYPHGIPEADYVPLLAVLRRRLTEEEITLINEISAHNTTITTMVGRFLQIDTQGARSIVFEIGKSHS